MNEERFEILKNRVLKHRVKKLPLDIKHFITNNSKYQTLSDKSVDVLQQHGYLNWPLSKKEHEEAVNNFPDGQIQRYIQILIFQNWYKTANLDLQEIWKELSDYKKLWFYVNNIKHIPTCSMCSNFTRWSQKRKRYTYHCSNRCRAIDPEVENKRKQTNIEKYGYDKSLINNTHLNKTRETLYNNYKVFMPFQNEQLRKKAVKKCEQLYGKQYLSQKRVERLREIYSNNPHLKEKRIEKAKQTKIGKWLPLRLQSFSHIAIPLFEINQYNSVQQQLPYKCVKCNSIFKSDIKNGSFPRCLNCYPYNNVNWKEKELVDYCNTLGMEIIENTRKIITPYELDIYIPSEKIAIEFNGLYWHSEFGSKNRVNKNYHLEKTIKCKEKGIQLIHIFEDEWNQKQNIIKSIIESKLKIIPNKICARQCSIVKLNHQTCSNFLEENHIKGKDQSKLKYGLVFQNNLVAVMTFDNFTQNRHQWKIKRFCNTRNTIVVGGASKLLKFFVKKHNPSVISTHVDRRYFNGELYKKLGFVCQDVIEPSYYYVNINEGCTQRYSEMIMQEQQAMKNTHFSKIWDCGSFAFIKHIGK